MHLSNRTTEQWQKIDSAHHLHPFTDFKELINTGTRIIISGKGNYVTDSENNKILDMMAGLWCVNIGYGRKELAEVAFEQMQLLPYYNSFFKTATTPSIELSKILADITPEGIERFFYGSSGSESNDTVVRLVRRYWDILGKKNKKTFISRTFAYHGSTMASASLGGMQAMHNQGDLPLPGFVHAMPPYQYKFGKNINEDEFCKFAVNEIEKKIIEIGSDNVAAFIGEPIQGAGGVIVPPRDYWNLIQDLCKKYDILLCIDEVICGFGRTGEWFGSQHYNIKPDVITFAKGITSGYLPLSGVGIGKKISDVVIKQGGEFYHGYTYSAIPVSMAAGLAMQNIIEKENLIQRSKDMSPYFLDGLFSLKDIDVITDIRGYGMLGGIDIRLDERPGKAGYSCFKKLFEAGLSLKATGDCLIVAPPFICEKEHIDEIIEKLRTGITNYMKSK